MLLVNRYRLRVPRIQRIIIASSQSSNRSPKSHLLPTSSTTLSGICRAHRRNLFSLVRPVPTKRNVSFAMVSIWKLRKLPSHTVRPNRSDYFGGCGVLQCSRTVLLCFHHTLGLYQGAVSFFTLVSIKVLFSPLLGLYDGTAFPYTLVPTTVKSRALLDILSGTSTSR